MRIVIISMLFIFSYAQDCSQCENTWPDQTGYWGEQCCDVAFDQWGYDCEYMENQYGWDCTGCSCPYDDFSECGDEYCTADENFDNCPSDCTLNGCNTANQVDDCSGDGDCVPDSWIGDGYCDSEDQPFGVDLTCYANDGGDCPAEAGDLNNDGFINIADIIFIIDFILDYEQNLDLDLNFDNNLNIQDVLIIIYIILN